MPSIRVKENEPFKWPCAVSNALLKNWPADRAARPQFYEK